MCGWWLAYEKLYFFVVTFALLTSMPDAHSFDLLSFSFSDFADSLPSTTTTTTTNAPKTINFICRIAVEIKVYVLSM